MNMDRTWYKQLVTLTLMIVSMMGSLNLSSQDISISELAKIYKMRFDKAQIWFSQNSFEYRESSEARSSVDNKVTVHHFFHKIGSGTVLRFVTSLEGKTQYVILEIGKNNYYKYLNILVNGPYVYIGNKDIQNGVAVEYRFNNNIIRLMMQKGFIDQDTIRYGLVIE